MKRIWTVLIFAIACSSAIAGQDVRPAPTPTPDDDDVVKISTNLIQFDVTITDAKGKPIKDLTPDEVEIYENGVKQSITGFSFVSASQPAEQAARPADPTAPPVPPKNLRPDQIRRTIALVFDDLSLSFESAYQTRRSLKKFVDEQMQDGDLVAIIRTGAGIGALQQFTSDKRLLYAAIEKVKWNPAGSGGISAFAPIEATPDTSLQETEDEDAEAAPAGNGQSLNDFRSSIFATGTLGALRYIVNGMGELPGRKSVILFSDGFKLFDEDMGVQEAGQVLDFLRQLVETANRSSVVFYTIDARGLVHTGFTAADQPSDAASLTTALSQRSDQLFDTQEGLNYLANETGGFSIKNSNDLTGGVRKVLEDQSYYLIAYEPDADTFDPQKRKYNKIEVKVLRKGAKARYRSGFFNVADRPVVNGAREMTPIAQLESALVSPFGVSGINLRLNALFGSDAKNGSFVRSLLHINAADLKFADEKDGTKKAVFDLLAMSFGDNGQPIDEIARTYTLILKPDAYRKTVADGFVYHFMFPVKKAGAYQYRVAIRDTVGGKIGSASQFIEVPNLKKGALTVSSVVLESLTAEEWRKDSQPDQPRLRTAPMSDTALRRIKAGSVLRYGFEIYNAKSGLLQPSGLRSRIRVFREGEIVLDGRETAVEPSGQTDARHLKAAGALALGEKMKPGDYVLQVIITDEAFSPKRRIATQIVQFEVVDPRPAATN